MNSKYSDINLAIEGEVFSWNQKRGIPRIYAELIPRICRQDEKINITINIQEQCECLFHELPITIRKIPSISLSLRPWFIWGRIAPFINKILYRRFWLKEKADVYFSPHYKLPLFCKPAVCCVYDMIPELFPDSYEQGEALRIAQAKKNAVVSASIIVCISENTKQDVIRLLDVPESKCRVMYCAASLPDSGDDLTTNVLPFDNCEPFILYVGGFKARYKNFEMLLEFMGKQTINKKLKLIVVSPEYPSEKEFKDYYSKVPKDRLGFVTNCSDEQLVILYKKCLCLVFPSCYEGFGLPVLEALSCGAPVACSNSSSLPEVGGDVVHYFSPDSVGECSVAIETALREGRSDEAVRRRKKWAATFSWDRAAKEFCEIVRELSTD